MAYSTHTYYSTSRTLEARKHRARPHKMPSKSHRSQEVHPKKTGSEQKKPALISQCGVLVHINQVENHDALCRLTECVGKCKSIAGVMTNIFSFWNPAPAQCRIDHSRPYPTHRMGKTSRIRIGRRNPSPGHRGIEASINACIQN